MPCVQNSGDSKPSANRKIRTAAHRRAWDLTEQFPFLHGTRHRVHFIRSKSGAVAEVRLQTGQWQRQIALWILRVIPGLSTLRIILRSETQTNSDEAPAYGCVSVPTHPRLSASGYFTLLLKAKLLLCTITGNKSTDGQNHDVLLTMAAQTLFERLEKATFW